MRVAWMAEADHDLGAGRAEAGNLPSGERKVDKLNRRSFAFGGGPVDIALGHTGDPLACEFQKGRLFYATEARQKIFPSDRVIDLEHHGCNQFAAVRDEWVVRGQLVLDLRLAAPLD